MADSIADVETAARPDSLLVAQTQYLNRSCWVAGGPDLLRWHHLTNSWR